METVVVCSGRKRAHWSNGQWLPTPRRRPRTGTGGGSVEVERSEAKLIHDDQVGPQELVYDSAHRVVRQATVESFDQVGRGEVANPVTGGHGGMAQPHQQVGLPSARWADEANVLVGPDPLQGGQVVEGGLGDGGQVDLEPIEALDDWEAGQFELGRQVGLLPSRNLGLDQSAE